MSRHREKHMALNEDKNQKSAIWHALLSGAYKLTSAFVCLSVSFMADIHVLTTQNLNRLLTSKRALFL